MAKKGTKIDAATARKRAVKQMRAAVVAVRAERDRERQGVRDPSDIEAIRMLRDALEGMIDSFEGYNHHPEAAYASAKAAMDDTEDRAV